MGNYCIIPDTQNNIIELTNKDCEITLKSALPAGLPDHHNFTHYIGGVDPLSPQDIGAQPSGNYSIVGHHHTISDISDLTLANIGAQPSGNYIIEGDSRLTDNRFPLSHNSTHFINGSDPILFSDIGAQNAWESPVFIANSFTAQKNKHYIIKSQIGVSPTVLSIVDPTSPSVGDFYVVYHEGGPYINIGGIVYINRGTLLFRVYEASGLSAQWRTQIISTPQTLVKAWVNYNGVSRTIRDSYNISSVTYNSTGSYTINFTTPFTNTNYSIVAFARDFDSDSYVANLASLRANSAKSTTSISLTSCYIRTGVLYDSPEFNVAIFS